MKIKKNKRQNDAVDIHKIINESSPFAIKEAFSTLCTNVLYLPIDDNCKKIAVTSSFSGEGKTYVSTNLAITLAKNLPNKKVLLVDMDMRNPSITRLLNKLFKNKSVKHGLSEFLAGIDAEPEINSFFEPNLHVLFAGAESTNPAGLINSARMTDLFKKIEQEYDYVIIDTPPVNVVSDATLLVDKVNGYLITTRSDYSNINSLSDVLQTIEKVGATVFGVVLSDVNPKKSVGYGKYNKYGSYSKYYGHEN